METPTPTRSARRAILCVLAASFFFSISAALVKSVGHAVPTIEVVFFRSFFAGLATVPLLMRQGGFRALRTRHPWSHVGRVVTGFSGMITSFYGFATLPLAINTALGFGMPLVLTILSVPLLGERVGWRRVAAVIVGLAGILIVVRPWRSDALPMFPVAVVLLGVLAWALSMVSIRRMGAVGESSVAIMLWFSIGSSSVAALCMLPVWVTPTLPELAVLISVGLVSTFAQLLMTEGYRSGETTLVAPFEYGAIVYTTLLGLVIWHEIPDVWNFVGIAVIVGSGLYIWHREAVRKSR